MPGLLRGVARTAVVAGTATAVSNRVSRRQARRWGAQEAYAEPQQQQQYANRAPNDAPRSAPARARDDEPAAPPTVLIFRDGHRLEVSNYTVAGRTLGIFSEQRARRIPLAELNLEATRKANEERGLEFAVRNKPPLP